MQKNLTFRTYAQYCLLAGSVAVGAYACSDSDGSVPGGTGGSGANGGTSSTGGTAGTGGSGNAGGGAGTAGTGGSSGSGGGGGSGGSSGTGGSGGSSGGSSGAGGSSGSAGGGGSSGSGGSAGSGGSSGSGGSTGGTGGTAGSGGAGGGTGEKFSFFVTSFKAMQRLSGNDLGFGGDLRFGQADGLTGADEICKQIAETSMPANGKTWRAFLSVTSGPGGTPVNAIDRIGEGPWYDRLGRVLGMNKAALLNERPEGADPLIINDLPNEDGVPNWDPDGTGKVDNHNFLTGSDEQGELVGTDTADTCEDWTSSAEDGSPRCGVTWPRASLVNWISVLNEGGCAPGATPPGQDQGTPGTVGALGGYGGFYCFALTP